MTFDPMLKTAFGKDTDITDVKSLRFSVIQCGHSKLLE